MCLIIFSHIQSPDGWPAKEETILKNGLIRIDGLPLGLTHLGLGVPYSVPTMPLRLAR